MSNNKMLIDAGHPEETRVVMVRGNRVEEFDFESEHKTQLRGNIYLAKVTRVEPSLQAAFVDYGGNRHGFLAFSEIHPDYYQIPVADRQALLEAEAEDAREAAEAEARQDQEDEEAEEAKPARKRRSRRRSKKAAKEDEETKASEGAADADAEAASEGDATEDNQDNSNDVAEASADDAEEPVAEAESAAEANEPEAAEEEAVAETAGASADDAAESDADNDEESDDGKTIAAENDGDDVVSEPASKAKKTTRRPRKTTKKAKEAEAAEDTPAEADADGEKGDDAEAATEPPRRTRRRTSRVKAKDSEVDQTSDAGGEAEAGEASEAAAEAGQDDEAEAKPKRRRTTRRKKTAAEEEPVAEETEAAEAAEAAETAAEDEAEAEQEAKPRRTRSRSRSRKRKSSADADVEAQDDNGDSDDDAVAADAGENGESVEELGSEDALEEVPARRAPRRHYKIQEVIKRRQILLVQVVKEERGNKGAALTTYLSLAGRYSVLMPNTARGGGISRKITNAADRKRLKSIAAGLEVPQGMGVILRTAGASRQQEDIQRDFEYLMRLWENVRSLTLESTAPHLVYEEGSLIKRSIRDLYDKDTNEILVSGEEGYKEAKDFMTMLMPNHAKNVKQYRDRVPMFARMGVEAQLDAMFQPEVTLKSGGYIIIDQTEALVAIDVNSGRSTRQHSIEETAVATNLEAADEVARQLRLRDLAGLIVIDFIDMEDKRNIRSVEKRLKDALKNDRARIQVGRISHFGLMEMSRQRIRASVLESTTQTCPVCDGLGHVRATSSIAISVLRAVEEQLNRSSRHNLVVKVSADTAIYILNHKRENIGDLETRFGVSISVATDATLGNTPCVIERGELSNKRVLNETSVQPDSIELSEDLQQSAETEDSAADEQHADGELNGSGRKRRRRRRRRRGGKGNEDGSEAVDNAEAMEADAAASDADASNEAAETESASDAESAVEAEEVKPKRTRRTRAKKAESEEPAQDAAAEDSETSQDAEASEAEKAPAKKTTRTRRKKAAPKEETPETAEAEATAEANAETESAEAAEAARKPRRRTTRRKKSDEDSAEETADASPSEPVEPTIVAQANEVEAADSEPKKTGWWQRKFF